MKQPFQKLKQPFQEQKWLKFQKGPKNSCFLHDTSQIGKKTVIRTPVSHDIEVAKEFGVDITCELEENGCAWTEKLK